MVTEVKDTSKKRMLTGYRPTGRLHLGHWHGNLLNMLKYQAEYESYFFIADWHALTSDYADTSQLLANVEEMILDWLAAGIDPDKCNIYRQSDLPEVAELHLYLSMITPLGWLQRNPTYKEQQEQVTTKDLSTYGFLGYPVLQCADIVIMGADVVPVGEDQLPHLELAREIVRRFTHFYGDYLIEPQALVSHAKKVPGTDGRKMSKSYDNAIFLTDEKDDVAKKVRQMITDPAKIRKDDPGDPDICSVFELDKAYASAEELAKIDKECRAGTLGCVEHKLGLAERTSASLADFQTRRAELGGVAGLVDQTLAEGAAKVRPIAEEAMHTVRKLMKVE